MTTGQSDGGPVAGRVAGPGRAVAIFVKLAVGALLLYMLINRVDVAALGQALIHANIGAVVLAVIGLTFTVSLNALRWRIIVGQLGGRVSAQTALAGTFEGMFFNLFLPTIVGGDAVKAVLLARETGAPARATMSVFMERNTGLCALLAVALVAAYDAPAVHLFGVSLVALVWLLSLGYVIANVTLMSPMAYHLVDRVIAATPLSRMRPRAATLYQAVAPYKAAVPTLAAALVLSLAFQLLVIAVVFLNARALNLVVPISAVAVFVPLVSLAGMVPVSVNGLGVREALYILLFGQIGVTAEVAVSLALLYLAVTVVASLPGGVVYALQRTPLGITAAGEAAPDLH